MIKFLVLDLILSEIYFIYLKIGRLESFNIMINTKIYRVAFSVTKEVGLNH